ncbi:MAG: acylneuraminate cytidylyltransferase family protein [Cyanobacteriota bacterium]|nr:acylneuraminate cytidylyltransferase family protein [Cyanobacteriota bacterium]
MNSHPTAIALIPARGGSKGVPGKNLRLVGGRSLLQRCIEAAQAASRVDRVLVSTDDSAIAAAATASGAEVVQRPMELAGDRASSESALLHALSNLAAAGPLPDLVVFLQCTSPFTRGTQIDQVVEALLDSEAAMAFAVVPWHGFLWSHDAEGLGLGVNHDPDQPRQRRQDLEPVYLETGSIYVLRTAPFLAAGHRFVSPRLPVPIEGPAPEVDTPFDLRLVECLAPLLDGEGRP